VNVEPASHSRARGLCAVANGTLTYLTRTHHPRPSFQPASPFAAPRHTVHTQRMPAIQAARSRHDACRLSDLSGQSATPAAQPAEQPRSICAGRQCIWAAAAAWLRVAFVWHCPSLSLSVIQCTSRAVDRVYTALALALHKTRRRPSAHDLIAHRLIAIITSSPQLISSSPLIQRRQRGAQWSLSGRSATQYSLHNERLRAFSAAHA
jgi:hypothetical protein